jgi:uncharacterized membrane protein
MDTANKHKRIASIDWMRGFVMILMLVDHVSMAYNRNHISTDSAALFIPGSELPELGFFVRWVSHLCAPVFVFLAGTALAISVERKVARGIEAVQIDKDILIRGAFIAILDPTIISLFSGRMTIQVLYAIGAAMMCMALLRRFSSTTLIVSALAIIVFGEMATAPFWPPQQDTQSIIAALFISTYASDELAIKYPLLPWLAMMMLGWVFGRYLLAYREGHTRIGPVSLLLLLAATALLAFAAIRYNNGYGNMFLYREDNSWQHWLHVSKYPPSAAFTFLELGILFFCLAVMIIIERIIGVRKNGILLIFGQTAMFFYLVHRLLLEGTATHAGLRYFGDLNTVFVVSLIMTALLYPLCWWYRRFKAKHPDSVLLKYI